MCGIAGKVLEDPRARVDPELAHARALDPEGLAGLLALGYAPAPRTFFRGIRELPPGHQLQHGIHVQAA